MSSSGATRTSLVVQGTAPSISHSGLCNQIKVPTAAPRYTKKHFQHTPETTAVRIHSSTRLAISAAGWYVKYCSFALVREVLPPRDGVPWTPRFGAQQPPAVSASRAAPYARTCRGSSVGQMMPQRSACESSKSTRYAIMCTTGPKTIVNGLCVCWKPSPR